MIILENLKKKLKLLPISLINKPRSLNESNVFRYFFLDILNNSFKNIMLKNSKYLSFS